MTPAMMRLRNRVFALDLLHVLAHGAADFSGFRELFTSDRPVRTGIGVDLSAIHCKIYTFERPDIHALLDNPLEEIEEKR
jgi:hypothetical protein